MDREIPQEEIRRRKVKRIVTVAGIALGCSALLYGAMLLMTPKIDISDIRICKASVGVMETSINSSGIVEPAYEEIITSPIRSRIIEVYCSAGDNVEAGTPILRLDLQSAETEMRKLSDQMHMKQVELDKQSVTGATSLADLEMRIKVKEMEVSRLKVELSNERYLDSLGSGTGDKVREVELAYNTGCLSLELLRKQLAGERHMADADKRVKELEINIYKNNIEEMRRTLDDARIRAPRSATISFINDQIGQKVSEGEKLAILSDLSNFKITAQAPDIYADNIRIGASAVIKAGKVKFNGSVMRVEPQSQNGMIIFDIRINPEYMSMLRAGLKTDVYVLHDIRTDVTRISNGSYYKGPGEYDMFVLSSDGGSIMRKNVSLGESNYEYVEVISGLSPGEEVVVSDMSDYKNTNKIKLYKNVNN